VLVILHLLLQAKAHLVVLVSMVLQITVLAVVEVAVHLVLLVLLEHQQQVVTVEQVLLHQFLDHL
jgi:hypothetical protein